MTTPQLLAVLTAALIGLVPVVSPAQHSHGHGSSGGGMAMEMREVLVDDLKVTFHIMANAEHRKMLKEMKMKEEIEAGTTHNISVTLTDPSGQKPVTDAVVGMKVVDPAGKDQIKSLRYEGSMKSFDAYFNLPQKG
ncbi:MAG: hypothetical protein MUF46_04970, partial [Desulfobacterales bacterium]|nr:hypothetical protein [Desulfobacterales bacterium]